MGASKTGLELYNQLQIVRKILKNFIDLSMKLSNEFYLINPQESRDEKVEANLPII